MNKLEKQTFYFETISEFLIENIIKYNLKHILVYLQNQEKVYLMEKKLINIRKDNKYNVYTILSDQSKSVRTTNLREFKTSTQFANILLSVGIFDEGVDEPCIDSVMFAEERNTESRIVQNIGRCLRLYPGKEKSYVILPNIVYEFDTDNSNLSLTNTYSSCFKTIREVISILKKPCNNKFYKKYVKGTVPNYSDDEDNDKINTADNYILENIVNTNEDIKSFNIDTSIIKLSKYYEQLCTNDSINNESLENIKNLITECNIKSVYEYGFLFKNTPYHILHNEYKSEWISWSHFLYGTVYSYEDAKQFIQSLDIKFKNSTEWIKYYDDLLCDELNDNKPSNYDIFNNIIKIPNRPKEYYKGEWIDWNDFLNLNIIDNLNTLLINQNGNSENKADKNIRVFINTDSDKVMKFNNGAYNDIVFKKDIAPIKNYIDNALGIDSYLVPRLLIKKNGNFDKLCINCYIKNKASVKPLIIIWPEDRKYIYDPINLHNNNIDFRTEINRNKDEYIQNNNIIKLFEELIIECKDIVNKSKNNT